MKPYVYKITNKEGCYYYGARWAYDGEPEDDLFVNYFTSSTLIHEMIEIKGIDFFETEIITITDSHRKCLDIEYELIKKNFDDSKCLNRAIGKCTIWDDKLKKQVSNSVSKLWDKDSHRNNFSEKNSGDKNHNYKKPPWRNVNGDKQNWYKAKEIYNDFIKESWDFNKYGMGRYYLIKRYKISQGMSRSLISKLKSGWIPTEDNDFIDYCNAR